MKTNPYFPALQYERRSSMRLSWKVAVPIALLACAAVMAYVFGDQTGGASAALPVPTERVIVEASRPAKNTGEKLWLSLWVHADYQDREDEKKLVEMFDNDDRLQWIKAETNFALYDDSHPRYKRQEFRDAFPVLPCVILQKPDGEVLEKWSGDDIPWKYGLIRTLQNHVDGKVVERKRGFRSRNRDCPDGQCLPLPPPDKEEAIREDEQVGPPEVEPEPDLPFPTALAIGSGLFALAAGVLIGVARYKGK